MSTRKRINISLDPDTYERLRDLQKEHQFNNLCEMVVALVHILLDRTDDVRHRKYDLPEDDGRYIDTMFDELGHVHRVPDGTVPVRHNRKKIR